MLPIIEGLDPIDAWTMLLWCRDRVRDAAKFDLPDDVGEVVEDKIREIAVRVEQARGGEN
jgi:hypothetical protein